MSDSSTSSSNNKTSFILPIVVVIILIAAVGYFATMQSGLDEKIVKAKLDSWISSYQQANPQNTISYGSLEISGPTNDRFARIHDVVIDKTAEEVEQRYKLSIPVVDINPESLSFDRFTVTIAGPMHVSTENERIEIASSTPIRADIQLIDEVSPAVQYDIPMPANISLTSEQGDSVIAIATSEGSNISGRMPQSGSGSGEYDIALKGLNIIETETDKTTSMVIASAVLQSSYTNWDQPKGAFDFVLDVDELVAAEDKIPYGAISMRIDLDYSGPTFDVGEEDQIDWTTEKALINIDEFSIETKDVALNSHLNFQTGTGEILPVGKGSITLDNLPFLLEELRKNDMLNEPQQDVLAALVKQITGSPIDEVTNLDIPIKREDGGSLQIGKSSFEELFAIVLTGGKLQPSGNGMSSSPAVPPSSSPLQAGPDAIDESEVEELFNAE